MTGLLSGVRVLVIEDEFLIAMDVEQICKDAGASNVIIARNLDEAHAAEPSTFDAAILDMMVGGASTFEFATTLRDRGAPFVFASGYTEPDEIANSFPGDDVVGKPYSGDELVGALAAACERRRQADYAV